MILSAALALVLAGGAIVPAYAQTKPAAETPRVHDHNGKTFFGASPTTPEQKDLSNQVCDLLANEDEKGADAAIAAYLEKNPKDQGVMLLRAVVVRGRGDIAGAKPLFARVVAAGKETDEGKCAALMLDIDAERHVPENYAALRALADAHQYRDQMRWLAALAAYKLGYTNDAIEMVNGSSFLTVGGPVNSRRLYADLLDAARQFNQALTVREDLGAIKQTSWSVEGLARSAVLVRDFDAAATNGSIAVNIDEKNGEAWTTWARALYGQAKYKDAEAKARKGVELSKESMQAHITLARVLDKLDRPGEAYEEYWRASMGGRPQPGLMAAQRVLALPVPMAIAEVKKYFSMGRQADAEAIVRALLAAHPADVSLIFLEGMCIRSRFDVEAAAPYFQAVVRASPNSPQGQCARLMLQIDARQDAENSYAKLVKLVEGHTDDAWMLWMGAIASRTLDKNEIGVVLYGELLKHFAVGPSLLHQTFANLLDNVGNYELALAHRKMAVRLEPAGWSYQGMGNTLANLQEYEEADKAYAKAIELAPGNSMYWRTWGSALYKWGHMDDAVAKCKEATRLNPQDGLAFNTWGLCLAAQGKLDEALAKYETAMQVDPGSPYAFGNAADIYERRGDSAKAAALRAKAASLR